MKRYMATTLATAALVLAGPALAEYPQDDRITFVIPYSPGGGFDTIVRAFSPALEEAMDATVVPENIPGASGTRGGQAVHRADPDGYTIGIYNIPGLTVSEATDRDIGFSLSEVTWIANLASEAYAIAVKADSPIQSMEDLCNLGQPAKLSDTGLDSTSSITSVISFDIMGCPLTNVTGYAGSNDAMIAVIRGEVDATLKPVASLLQYTEEGTGDLRLIVTYTEEEVVPGVPTVVDIGYPELAKFSVNRVIGGPPGMPEDVVAMLEEGFRKAVDAPAVQEWANSSGVDLDFMGAEETKAMMDDLASFYVQYKDLLTN
jgi:tripartite-type tricarboxylate transporter receptor subunit TctC